MRTTSIIIPTFNGKEMLKNCIYSIKEHTEQPYEVIVVDNGSSDGTADFCRQEGISFISIAINSGFPIACNKGLKLSSGDDLLLLNNDVIVSKNWLTNMQRCLHSRHDIGIVGPLTNYASGKQQIQMPYTNLDEMSNQLNNPDSTKWQPVDRIVGLCMLFRREMMDMIGYLDESFSPGHYEDDDYCMRARNAGYRLFIAGDSFIFHHGSASFSQQGEEVVQELIERNRQKFIAKWGCDPNIYI